MFDVSWGELVLIGMVALVVIGPKELPTVLRTMGQWMTKIRRMAAEFQGQFHEAMREAEMADLKKQVEGLTDPVKTFSEYNPLETTRSELE
ncbi:MAG: twin-arginine translocase subunit TatB, partial [Variibacter sp.]|nr:twin-arginine translocase subunit TatB [Variibacter sp.]